MPRDFRRFTNVDDLLDDGIENNSDLSSRTEEASADLSETDSRALQIQANTIAKVQKEQEQDRMAQRRKDYNLFGIVLGAILAISGLGLAMHPIAMRVEHARMKYLPTVVEQVTPNRGRLYGFSLFAFGLVLIYFSGPRIKSRA